jgi:Zn-dependent peptidase ImmA (M78 family)
MARRIRDAVQSLLNSQEIRRPPINVHAIAEFLDVTVVETAMSQDVSGMLVRDDQDLTIGLNRAHPQARKRFTLAHEIGHLTLHRGRPLIVDAAVRINLRDRTSATATDREEIEANQFAAELLMPVRMMMEAVADAKATTPDELQRELARRFRVSEEAMGYRLVNLGLTS